MPSSPASPPTTTTTTITSKRSEGVVKEKTTKKRKKSKSKCLISISATWYSLFVVLIHVYLVKNHIETLLRMPSTTADVSSSSVIVDDEEHQHTTKINRSAILRGESGVVSHTDLNEMFELLRAEIDEPSANRTELIVRVLSLSLSVFFLFLFVLASLQQCANYANDSVKFGRDFFAEQLHHHNKHVSRERYEKAKSSPPPPPTTTTTTNSSSSDSGRGTAAATLESSSSSASSISSSSDSSSSSSSSSSSRSVKRSQRRRRGVVSRCLGGLKRLMELMWRHFLPFAPLTHLLSILLLVVPDLMFAPVHELREQIDKAHANTTACYHLQQSSNSNGSALTINCLVDLLFNQNSGLLVKFILADTTTTTTTPTDSHFSSSLDFDKEYFLQQIASHYVELVSLSLAFATLSIRYGSVFWYTNKTLSYIITIIGFVSSIQQLFQLYSFAYINRQIMFNHFDRLSRLILSRIILKINSPSIISGGSGGGGGLESRSSGVTISSAASSSTSNTFDTYLITSLNEFYLINARLKLVFVYTVLGVLVLLTLVPAYAFVYLKYKERFLIEEAHFLSAILNSDHNKSATRRRSATLHRHSETSTTKIRQSDDEMVMRFDQMSLLTDETKLEPSKLISEQINVAAAAEDNDRTSLALAIELNKSGCCFNYCPHLIATIQLILICLCKLPFCYDFILYFNSQKDFGIMMCIIVEIMHTIILLFIWLLLTLKTEWAMHLRASYSICHWTYHLKHHQMMQLRRVYTNNRHNRSVIAIADATNGAASTAATTSTNNTTASTSIIQKSEKLLIKGEENSRSLEMAMKMSQAQQQQQQHEQQQQVATKRCSLARADEFEENSNSLLEDEEEEINEQHLSSVPLQQQHRSDYNNQTMIVSHHHQYHHHHHHQFPVNHTNAAASFRKPTTSTSSEDLLTSETMYRNQIRKSIRNVLQHKRNSAISIPITNEVTSSPPINGSNRYYVHPQQFKIVTPPTIQSTTITASGRAQPVARLLGTGVYLTTSPSFAAESSSSSGGQFLTTASTPKPQQQQQAQQPTITTILTSSVFEIPASTSSQHPTTTTTSASNTVLYLNRPHSKEYESRV